MVDSEKAAFDIIWRESVRNNASKSCFLREDEEFLMQFGNMPVHLDIQTQTDFVNHMISMLDDRIKKHRIKRTANAGYTDVWVLQQEFFLCLF